LPTAAERAYDRILQGIAGGTYTAGERLREEELSAVLGMSRTPVREALRRLGAEGMIEFHTNRGAQVTSWSDAELNEIFDLRALLESFAAGRAATRMEAEDVARLDSLATAMEKAAEGKGRARLDRIAQLNNEFHLVLLTCSGSPQLVSLTGAIVHVPLVQRTFERYSTDDLRRSMLQHRELVDACRARDGGWAEAVMRSHVLSARHIFDGRDGHHPG